jgi:hypothetical protein
MNAPGKGKAVNAVSGSTQFIVRPTRNIQIHSVSRMLSSSIPRKMACIVMAYSRAKLTEVLLISDHCEEEMPLPFRFHLNTF